jgi:hypothetical protein
MLHWWASSPRHFEDHHAFIQEKEVHKEPLCRKTVCCPGKVMQVVACKCEWQANKNEMVVGRQH